MTAARRGLSARGGQLQESGLDRTPDGRQIIIDRPRFKKSHPSGWLFFGIRRERRLECAIEAAGGGFIHQFANWWIL